MAEQAPTNPGDFTAIIAILLQNPPDPNESAPVWNRKGTIYGITVPLQVLCWIFVITRIHTRIRIVRDPGLDDVFVVLAALFNLVSLIAFLCSLNYGMGKHIAFVLGTIQPLMRWLYLINAGYHTTTVCIKISLLLQYLRMFRDGTRRLISTILLVLVVLWGLVFMFMTWFPCFPVSGFWDKTLNAKCYGFGFRTAAEAKDSILGFAATNMAFDIAIFAIPLTEYCRKDVRRKELLAMTGLFTFGAIAVLMAILRLWTTFKHNNTAIQSLDFVWWYPEVLIISFLEVGFAIMCASMPIFWPTIVASLGEIFVTNEVRVTSHERLANDSQENIELRRASTTKSVDSAKGFPRSESEGRDPFDNVYITQPAKGDIYGTRVVEVQPQAQRSRPL